MGPIFLRFEMLKYVTVVVALCCWEKTILLAQDVSLDGREGRELLLRNFRPESQLKVDAHELVRARFPVVDVHTHFRLSLIHI